MRITYDGEADALYIAFGEGPAIVEEVAEGTALDWDSEGRLLGIEILDASKGLADPEALRRFALEAPPLLGQESAPGFRPGAESPLHDFPARFIAYGPISLLRRFSLSFTGVLQSSSRRPPVSPELGFRAQ